MERFGRFYLDKEKDIVVDLFLDDDELHYMLRTPNHHTGNLISNLAKLCSLPISEDEQGLKVIRGTVPSYVDGQNRRLFIFRLGNTKVANIWPDGSVELKASIPAISKTLMSQTKDYHLDEVRTIVKTYIRSEAKFRTDLHTHMNAILSPDILIALGICHQIRYPYYYIKKLGLRVSEKQRAALVSQRALVAQRFDGSPLVGKYRERRIDDNIFLNFADLILGNIPDAAWNIRQIRSSLTIPKDGQAVFADLEKVFLYRYVFTKGTPADETISLRQLEQIPDPDVLRICARILADRESPDFRNDTLFQDKLLWIARSYARCGIEYVEISDTTLVKKGEAVEMLRQVHQVMPAITRETGVLIRFLAGIRRVPLTIIKDAVTPNDYLAENLQVLRAVAVDPYVAGSDILGEEINDIQELHPVIRELVRIAQLDPGFVIRIHAGENDSLRDNVANSVMLVRQSLAPGQRMPHVRIGHGLYAADLHSPKGQQLLRDLVEDEVVLEFQITSNVRLNNLSDLGRHPLKAFLRAGVFCVQGTDGCALYGTDPIEEELSLEKMLGLSYEELCLMRAHDARIANGSRRIFREKSVRFDQERGDLSPAEHLARRIQETEKASDVLWLNKGKLDAREALSGQISDLPHGLFPIVIAGGSFNSDRHTTRLNEHNKQILDRLLSEADPGKCFFVVGHSCSGYEGYLIRRNAGRFPIYAIVPTSLSRAERDRLQRSGVSIRISIEPTGMGLYKSFAYEIFKRRPSALLAFDGNSAAANLVQEAKNGRQKCDIYLDVRSRALRAKAATLHGYVTDIAATEDVAGRILDEHALR
ncbi:MAG: adenosine deaminase [Oscillospiraceae bacterium]|nr:adenosine deaminase [Oscillospiraceae bacterium]